MAQPRPGAEEGSTPQTEMRRRGLFMRVIRCLPAAVLGLTVTAVLALGLGFAWFVARVPMEEPPLLAPADGIVVLTGGASRISDAVDLLAAGHGRRLLITGVHPAASVSGLARRVPEHERIFTCCIDLDHAAINTFGNATEARRWARRHGFRTLIVVTSAYHLPRAMAELAHQLPEATLIPFPVVTDKMREGRWWTSPATTRLLALEYGKYLLAHARMRLNPEATAPLASQVSDFKIRPTLR